MNKLEYLSCQCDTSLHLERVRIVQINFGLKLKLLLNLCLNFDFSGTS